ncbi:MAG: hypothetical protein F4014_12095 [Gemmatimonadetes bacterium]|nr:hypothetical protein [Gemmatimonadota bacterium]MYH20323.1 hypothetical protein [Gemmatimonadota bacterium]MYK99507.1 hypothetical protein [Gemmatimonadota bacterium]
MIPRDHWLIGSKGVYHGTIGGSWTRIGAQEYGISSLIREPGRLVAGASWGSGLWEWPNDAGQADQSEQSGRPDLTDRWKQLHDETLTEIMAIAPIEGSPGVVAGSPYGIATGRYDDLGAVRWTHHSDALRVNERFTNAILVHPDEPKTWLIGTEGGVLIADDSGAAWRRTSISSTAVRALACIHEQFWAGTDDRGIWRSEDGERWDSVGHTADGGAVFELMRAGDDIVAATEHGVAIGDGSGHWVRTGPRHLCAAVRCHPGSTSTWLAGATPSGLWYTEDGGHAWHQIPGFVNVRAIIEPEA